MAILKGDMKLMVRNLQDILVRGHGRALVKGAPLSEEQMKGAIIAFEYMLGVDTSLEFEWPENYGGAAPRKRRRRSPEAQPAKRGPKRAVARPALPDDDDDLDDEEDHEGEEE